MSASNNTSELLLSDFSRLQSGEIAGEPTPSSPKSTISGTVATSHKDFLSVLPKSSAPEFDVVLKTTDNVRFLARVHPASRLYGAREDFCQPRRKFFPILIRVSSSSTFTVLQEPSMSAPCTSESTVVDSEAFCPVSQHSAKDAIYEPDDFPVYNVAIASSSLKFILNTVYPTAPPLALPGMALDGTVSDSILVQHAGHAVMKAAVRYSMPKVLAVWSMNLLHVVNTVKGGADSYLPLQVYATACRFGQADVARSVAHACLEGKGFKDYTDQLEHIRGDAYFKLLDYRRKAVQAVMAIVNEDKAEQSAALFINSRPSLLTCKECGSFTAKSSTLVAEWWQTFVRLAITVLKEAPRSKKIFDTAFLSPVFSRAYSCESCSNSFCLKWSKVQKALKKDITKAIDSVLLDISCLNRCPGTLS